jgi:hypothetical protein
MSDVIVETDAVGPPETFSGPSDDLLAFLSFLAAERYGSTHELSAAALLLRRQHRIDTRPLFEFGDAVPEDNEDRAILDKLWQDAGPLAESASACAAAIRADPQLQTLTRAYPRLVERLAELAAMARRAADQGARIRVTYRL